MKHVQCHRWQPITVTENNVHDKLCMLKLSCSPRVNMKAKLGKVTHLDMLCIRSKFLRDLNAIIFVITSARGTEFFRYILFPSCLS